MAVKEIKAYTGKNRKGIEAKYVRSDFYSINQPKKPIDYEEERKRTANILTRVQGKKTIAYREI